MISMNEEPQNSRLDTKMVTKRRMCRICIKIATVLRQSLRQMCHFQVLKGRKYGKIGGVFYVGIWQKKE